MEEVSDACGGDHVTYRTGHAAESDPQRENAEDLTVSVVDRRGEQQQGTNDPAVWPMRAVDLAVGGVFMD